MIFAYTQVYAAQHTFINSHTSKLSKYTKHIQFLCNTPLGTFHAHLSHWLTTQSPPILILHFHKNFRVQTKLIKIFTYLSHFLLNSSTPLSQGFHLYSLQQQIHKSQENLKVKTEQLLTCILCTV